MRSPATVLATATLYFGYHFGNQGSGVSAQNMECVCSCTYNSASEVPLRIGGHVYVARKPPSVFIVCAALE